MLGKTAKMLELNKEPCSVAILEAPPKGIKKWNDGEVPSGCTFWLKAMGGETFYTDISSHFNCAIGCYTHKIDLPEDRAHELMDTLNFMFEKKYIKPEEVKNIPTLKQTPKIVAYGPAFQTPFKPDVVIVAAEPAKAMLLYEAAIRSGAEPPPTQILGRPGCAMIPLVIQTQTTALSFGCMGSRIFTELPENEMYVCIPGGKWDLVEEKVAEIFEANQQMKKYYESKKGEFASL